MRALNLAAPPRGSAAQRAPLESASAHSEPPLQWESVPELPEVEITARLLDHALRGALIESALAPGINALKTIDPALSELQGRHIDAVRRRGKHLIVEVSGGLALLVHLMNAGWDAADVQDWLGHRDIASTMVYAAVTNKRREAKYEEALLSEEIAANDAS